MSWEQLTNGDIPDWVQKNAVERRSGNPNVVGTEQILHGDTFVYKIEYGHDNHGHNYLYYRQLKSDYFDTTSEEGTCPNCQKYVRRLDNDEYLTCHRCGWQYKPLKDRLSNLF